MKKVLVVAFVAVGAAGLLYALWTPVERPEVELEQARLASAHVVAEIGGSSGWTYAVDSDGRTAVFGRGAELAIADVTDPANPRELRTVLLPGDIRDLRLNGSRVLVAADSAGLQVVDLASGTITGSLRFEDHAYGIDGAGDVAFVAARAKGLRTVDVSAVPNEIGHLVTPDEVVGVQVRDGFAYLATWYESFRVVDVTTPESPQELGFAPFDSYDHGAVWSVSADGALGVAAIPQKGLRIINLSDPANVSNHAVYRRLHAPAAVELTGSYAYVADQEAGLRILDLSSPQEPREVGSVELPGRALDVRVVGHIAYVATKEGGVRLVDVSRAHDPVEVGFLDRGDAIVDVASHGGTLLAAGIENGVYRYDGQLTTELDARASRLVSSGERVLTLGPDGVALFVEGRSTATLPVEAHGAAMQGERIVLAGPLGLSFVDGALRESSTFAPARSGSDSALFRSPLEAWDVVFVGDLAYAAFDDGIYILSPDASGESAHRVETAERPYRLLKTAERPYRLLEHGTMLLAACDDGLRVFDVSDPSDPRETAFVRTPSYATAVVAVGDTAYVGDLSGIVTAVDLSDVQSTTSWKVADRVLALAPHPHGLAVAAGLQGLRIVSLRVPEEPELRAPPPHAETAQ